MNLSPLHQDSYIIAGIRQGDNKIINSLYEKYFPRIQSLILSNNGNDADAYDVFQDAIMIIYEKSKRDEFELKSSFYTFLYAICKNIWLKRLKKKKIFGVTIHEEKVSTTDEGIITIINNRDKLRLYQEKFLQLGANCQKLLNLFFEGHSMREIAKIMKLSEKYTRKRKFLCKEKLVKLIQEDDLYQEIKENEG